MNNTKMFFFGTGWIEQETHFRSARHKFSKKWNREELGISFCSPNHSGFARLAEKALGTGCLKRRISPAICIGFRGVWRKPNVILFLRRIFFLKIQQNTPYKYVCLLSCV